jgi:hypothetical protein
MTGLCFASHGTPSAGANRNLNSFVLSPATPSYNPVLSLPGAPSTSSSTLKLASSTWSLLDSLSQSRGKLHLERALVLGYVEEEFLVPDWVEGVLDDVEDSFAEGDDYEWVHVPACARHYDEQIVSDNEGREGGEDVLFLRRGRSVAPCIFSITIPFMSFSLEKL